MDGAALLAYILRTFKRTDKDTELYEAITDTVIDMSLRFYPEQHKTRSSALTGCTTVGDYSLTLPTDFGHLIGDVTMIDATNQQKYNPLRQISIEGYDRLYPDRTLDAAYRVTGVPQHYCLYGGSILVGPVVDQTYYEFYINYTEENITAIVAGTTDVPFSTNYREVVKAGALMRIYNDLEMYQEAQIQENKYENGIAKIAANDELNSNATSSIVYSGI
jgi:hypothetical protein